MNKLLISLFLLSIVSIAFCKEPVVENQEKWSTNGVSVIGRLKHKKFSMDAPVVLKIIFKNSSNADMFIVLSHTFKQYKFTVFDIKRKKTVPLTIWGKHLKNQGFFRRIVEKIKNQDSYTLHLNIKRYFDLSFPSEYSISIEGKYLNKSKKFIPFKLENINFSIVME